MGRDRNSKEHKSRILNSGSNYTGVMFSFLVFLKLSREMAGQAQ